MASENPTTDSTKTNTNSDNAQQQQQQPQQKPTTGGGSSLSEAEKFLESLNLGDSQTDTQADTHKPASSADHKDIMSFLDEISQYPNNEEQTEKQKDKAPAAAAAQIASGTTEPKQSEQSQQASGGGSWMAWGNSLWSQASEAVKSTTEQINRSVETPAAKLLEDRVKHLQGYVNKENLGKLGKVSLSKRFGDVF
ncbi:hypothetical protein BDB00DRAFT_314067 [Zychaea mexicana]|uniref:uncharacterized protein n=1 Tax=Zychaea mexicana TaxID=64656 RepID=UPI0022FE5509|nr:uncharacterized protein BDB00DRAFT_314067 [Zychaea mexicana]KAI9494388.1 hypothetical protein BDB00DRAFT_314067 [Zychaea mexicana]